MQLCIYNVRLITPNLCYRGGILLEDDRIGDIFDENQALPPCPRVDGGGLYLAPGLIDIHTHGGGGADFMDDDPNAYKTACQSHLRHGTTALCPTTLTSTPEDLTHSLSAYEKALGLPDMPELLGLHLEGPYFSMEQRGAQDPRHLRNPDPREYLAVLDSSPHIKRWSLAPELPGALAMGLELRRRGILPAVAHSDAVLDQIARAGDYGFSLMTHFYSGMSTVRRIDGYRHPGVIEAGYLLDDFTVEVIADGHHLPPALLQLIYKEKGSSRICLVTDSMRAAGMPPGEYYLGKIGSGMPVIVEDGVAKLPDRTAFAGSVATTDRLLKTMVELGRVPLPEAVRMLTLTPARVMGAEERMGSLAAGKAANLVLLDDSLAVREVYLRGRKVVL